MAMTARDHHAETGAASCARCHDFEPAFSHPIDVRPSMAVPAHMPLEHGRMTCTTCHNVALGSTGLLRGDASLGPGFCVQCHDSARGPSSDIHAFATDRAHLATSRDRPSGSAWRTMRPDDESATCLGCHDGATASAAQVRVPIPGAGPGPASRLLGEQHPIGVVQRVRGVGDTLRHPHEIDPLVRLFDGRVGCGSCHSPYAPNDHLLVMSNQRSQLCLSCHDF
jgi:predicted CXXCH cytochrome family protein